MRPKEVTQIPQARARAVNSWLRFYSMTQNMVVFGTSLEEAMALFSPCLLRVGSGNLPHAHLCGQGGRNS